MSVISIYMLTEAMGTDKIVRKKLSVWNQKPEHNTGGTPTFKGLAEEEKSAQESEMYHQTVR